MINVGLTGVAQLTSAGTVGSEGKAIRVFTVCSGTTETESACLLFNARTRSGIPYISVLSSGAYFDSAQGVRFPDGCFAVCNTATISYIEEL